MFFFGLPSYQMQNRLPTDVSILISREESPFFYERLDQIHGVSVPQLREISYSAESESFVCRYGNNTFEAKKVEAFGREFIEEAIKIHISRA
jgi:hypothetical protein